MKRIQEEVQNIFSNSGEEIWESIERVEDFLDKKAEETGIDPRKIEVTIETENGPITMGRF